MSGLFGLDSPLIRFLTKFADLMLLNIIFVISCIPLFTIGAGIASLYEVTLKMVKNEESYIVKGYFTAFKSNFKKSTVIWLILSVMFFIFITDLYIINNSEGLAYYWTILYFVLCGMALVVWILTAYIFPLQAKFENSCKNTVMNALYMSARHLPTTIVVVFMNSIIIICLLVNAYTVVYGVLIYLVIGYAFVAYINSSFLVKVFEKYYDIVNSNTEVDVQE